MKTKLLQVLPWAIICLLLIYIGQCTTRGKPKPEIQFRDSLRIDSVVTVIDNTKHYTKPEPDVVYLPDSIPMPADTAELMKYCRQIAFEYYKSKIFNRHIVIDSIGYIDLRDSVTQNNLYGFAVKHHFEQLTVTKYDLRYTTPKKNKLVAGLILTGNDDYFGAAPVFGLKTKKDNTMLFGYDVINGNYTVGYIMSFGK